MKSLFDTSTSYGEEEKRGFVKPNAISPSSRPAASSSALEIA
jgi:hypothetical protein